MMLLSALMISMSPLLVHPFSVYGTTVAPGSLPSWNSAVHCTAIRTTIEGVIGNQANANGGATYGGGGFLPGIPNKRSISPPCTVNGNATFVEIHGVSIPSYVVEDCASYSNGSFCDTTFNAQDPKCASSDVYLCRMHMEIDQAWKSAGVAPQNPPTTTQLFDVQGFVYWDSGRDAYQWHSYSGWEIHALTAWRLASNNSPLSTSFTYSPASPSAGVQIAFTATASGGTQPYTYSWTFGDSGTASGSSVTHSYQAAGSYTVVVTVTDAAGQTASSTQTVTVSNSPPPTLTASFTHNPPSPLVGQQVTFSASATGGTGPYSFSWAFGDGSTGTGLSTAHTYSSPGNFTVTLTVRDSSSSQQTASSQQSVTVTSPPPPPLQASFTFNPSSPIAGQAVSFTGSAFGGVSPYSYSWSFGDGATALGSLVSHTFQSGGTYTVALTVTDSAGQIAKSSQTVTVASPLSASISYSPSNPSPLLPVTFTASATGGTQPYAYSWNFGDGTTDSGARVSHSYLLPGTYTVTLTVIDMNRQTATSSVTVTVTLL
jgi:PKD repeat protein